MVNRQQQIKLFQEGRLHPWIHDHAVTILHSLSDPGLNGEPEAAEDLRVIYRQKAETYKDRFASEEDYEDFMERLDEYEVADQEPHDVVAALSDGEPVEKPGEVDSEPTQEPKPGATDAPEEAQGGEEFASPAEYKKHLEGLTMKQLKPIAEKYGAKMARSKADSVKAIMKAAKEQNS